MDQKSNLLEELNKYEILENDWNGYGISKPSLISINKIRDLINYIHHYNHLILQYSNVMIPDDNDISLYWKLDDLYIEIGYSSDSDYNAYYVLIKTEDYYANLDAVKNIKEIPLNIIYKCICY